MRRRGVGRERGDSAAPDHEVVRRVRAGASKDFGILVQRHTRGVRRTVRCLLRHDADVEDAVQQTFLQAFAAIGTFERASSFRTWITRIAVNEATMRLRRRSVAADVPRDLEEVPSPAAGPDRRAEAREEIAAVRRGVERLAPRNREVFRLRLVEGLSTREVASRLGITETAVKLRLHRAFRVLRAATRPGE